MKKPSLLKMKEISKRFGSNVVLNNVDFEIDEGEVVGLVGDNGAGKTTLMKILAGVLPKDSGEIYWKGKRMENYSVETARRMGIEIIYQTQATIPDLDVAENIYLGREITKSPFKILDVKSMREQSIKLIKTLNLSISDMGQELRFCSGGEARGVAVARAMCFKSKIIIADEPTTALSPAGVRMVINFLKEAGEKGIGVIFVTHNIHYIYPIAKRFVILSRGSVKNRILKKDTSVKEIEDEIVKSKTR